MSRVSINNRSVQGKIPEKFSPIAQVLNTIVTIVSGSMITSNYATYWMYISFTGPQYEWGTDHRKDMRGANPTSGMACQNLMKND